MSAQTQPVIKLGVPKGSLEEATINLFERAGWKSASIPAITFRISTTRK